MRVFSRALAVALLLATLPAAHAQLRRPDLTPDQRPSFTARVSPIAPQSSDGTFRLHSLKGVVQWQTNPSGGGRLVWWPFAEEEGQRGELSFALNMSANTAYRFECAHASISVIVSIGALNSSAPQTRLMDVRSRDDGMTVTLPASQAAGWREVRIMGEGPIESCAVTPVSS